MSPGLFLLLVIFLVSGLASYAISRVVHNRLVKAGSANAKLVSNLTMVGSFIIITAAMIILIIMNVSFER